MRPDYYTTTVADAAGYERDHSDAEDERPTRAELAANGDCIRCKGSGCRLCLL